jgi:hypothetical protein
MAKKGRPPMASHWLICLLRGHLHAPRPYPALSAAGHSLGHLHAEVAAGYIGGATSYPSIPSFDDPYPTYYVSCRRRLCIKPRISADSMARSTALCVLLLVALFAGLFDHDEDGRFVKRLITTDLPCNLCLVQRCKLWDCSQYSSELAADSVRTIDDLISAMDRFRMSAIRV